MLPRLLHIALAALVAYASIGVSFRAHYCMDRLVDWSITGEARTCGMEAEAPAVPSDEPTVSRTPCCEDVHVFSQLDVEDVQLAEVDLGTADFAFSVPSPQVGRQRLPSAEAIALLLAPRPPPPLLAQCRRARLQRYQV